MCMYTHIIYIYTCLDCVCMFVSFVLLALLSSSLPRPASSSPRHRIPPSSSRRTAARTTCLGGNTNRVVSNLVVSKGPLYPSNTKTVTLLMFAGWNIPAQSNYRYIFLGPVLKPICKSGYIYIYIYICIHTHVYISLYIYIYIHM